ncbi:apoptosis facilitator Bcl-2-like protein 14 isoform X1 [Cricetulus griseus]|uniref:Apoptosis facilitator Bcl-2-like protein 14 isoform X1 n=1 Tax=Cricetulus griseus TaxID=10029 RepID=A0A9J7K115_CRIGR|nr:apoptosis facilitator Bcl-2-like protein 14 isoform X1 [Cricetulus griseus]XP_035310995.1 apoptosis facilitator Bcl-2-like protein 14 isoform X1 [Cricetulus griseus]ERE66694.1 apoptosis facilitator Bcl-2-like protein 14 [Cricetulus griseus]
MCSTSMHDLEDIPLEDDDSNSLEFKILTFYARHHVFKNPPAVFSPKLSRTRSLSQKALGTWSTDSWTQVSLPCKSSLSSEKHISLSKKKSSWRTFFRATEEESPPSSPKEIQAQGIQGPFAVERQCLKLQGGFHNQHWARSLSSVEQRLQCEAVDPKVASIANRVAEIVYSWPPAEDSHIQGSSFKLKESAPERLYLHFQGPQPVSCDSKKADGEDQVISRIVELLKYSGDHLGREMKKDKALMSSFQDGLSYSAFKTIADLFLRDIDTRGESEIRAHGFKAALAIDAIAKLTAIDNHPMNRMLGFGTKYLKEYFSPWVQQNGGWEKILGISHEEVD